MPGRRKPYTASGIRRIACSRCGAPSVHQWQVCANDNLYLGCCAECDIRLNRMALEFMRVPETETLLKRYVEKQS